MNKDLTQIEIAQSLQVTLLLYYDALRHWRVPAYLLEHAKHDKRKFARTLRAAIANLNAGQLPAIVIDSPLDKEKFRTLLSKTRKAINADHVLNNQGFWISSFAIKTLFSVNLLLPRFTYFTYNHPYATGITSFGLDVLLSLSTKNYVHLLGAAYKLGVTFNITNDNVATFIYLLETSTYLHYLPTTAIYGAVATVSAPIITDYFYGSTSYHHAVATDASKVIISCALAFTSLSAGFSAASMFATTFGLVSVCDCYYKGYNLYITYNQYNELSQNSKSVAPFFSGVFTKNYHTPLLSYMNLAYIDLLLKNLAQDISYKQIVGDSSVVSCIPAKVNKTLLSLEKKCYNCLGWASWENKWLALPSGMFYTTEESMVRSAQSFLRLSSQNQKDFALGENNFPNFIKSSCDIPKHNTIAFYFKCYNTCEWSHAARYLDEIKIDHQMRDIKEWTSKYGMGPLISHHNTQDISGVYGETVICLSPDWSH